MTAKQMLLERRTISGSTLNEGTFCQTSAKGSQSVRPGLTETLIFPFCYRDHLDVNRTVRWLVICYFLDPYTAAMCRLMGEVQESTAFPIRIADMPQERLKSPHCYWPSTATITGCALER